MNIIFFGSSQFAVPCLKVLLAAKHKISCVVTQADKEKGRGLSLGVTAVKAAAELCNLRIYQPRQVNDGDTVSFLKGLNPDLFIVVSYGQILSQRVLDIPGIFSINAHASLLPKYRGAAPINRAIINGDKITGVTIIKMTERMDAGAIMMQKTTKIKENDTFIILEEKLSKDAAALLIEAVNSIENNKYKLTPQDESKVTLAPKLKKEDGLIDWNKPAGEIYNLIRGCVKWPGAFTYYKDKLLKVYKARILEMPDAGYRIPAGELFRVDKDSIVVATGNGNLAIEELQVEGKRRMKVRDFIAGHKICAGEKFYKK
ncbi:MAG: methionyl-tRNA formyltransferase [Candidatus Omnitrophota bacterium]|jgi:methionyl-tRNA formyltransferase